MGCEMCTCVSLPARAMHIYLMHPLNLARGRPFAEHLAFMGMGVLRGRFRAKLPSFRRQSSHSGNIPPFNFRVPPLCTSTSSSSELNSRWNFPSEKRDRRKVGGKQRAFSGSEGEGEDWRRQGSGRFRNSCLTNRNSIPSSRSRWGGRV